MENNTRKAFAEEDKIAMEDKEVENRSICWRCNLVEVEDEPLDFIFRLNCDDCAAYRAKKIRLEWSMRMNTVLALCHHCRTSYSSGQPLVPHWCTRKDVFQCTRCQQLLYSEEDLRKHRKYLHRKSERCGISRGNVVNLGEHAYAQGEQTYKRSLHKIVKPSTSCIRGNQKKYSYVKSKQCLYCSKKFSFSCDLKRHTLTHTGERPYQCKFCKKKFSQSGNLESHIRIHTGEKPYRCQSCGKTFCQSSDLKRHFSVHTEERPYQCEVCEKRFYQAGHLQTHFRTHTGERPYQCECCMKTFSNTSNLQRHVRIHIGGKPYKCEFCAKRFSRSSHLKKHALTHTFNTG